MQKLSVYTSKFGKESDLFERVTWQEIKIETRPHERWSLANFVVQHRKQNRKPYSLKKLDAPDPFSCLRCHMDIAFSFRTPWQELRSGLEKHKCTLNCSKRNTLNIPQNISFLIVILSPACPQLLFADSKVIKKKVSNKRNMILSVWISHPSNQRNNHQLCGLHRVLQVGLYS